jgi:hypothetical protein
VDNHVEICLQAGLAPYGSHAVPLSSLHRSSAAKGVLNKKFSLFFGVVPVYVYLCRPGSAPGILPGLIRAKATKTTGCG